MRCEVTFAAPTPEHVRAVAGALRAADRAELAALCGSRWASAQRESYGWRQQRWAGDPQTVLEVSVLDSMMSGEVFTALNAEGAPFALFGVCCGANWLNWSGACVWMVGTDEVANHGRALLRHGRRFVRAWVAAYGLIGGFVHARHDAAVRTLARLGFHVNRDGAVLLGPLGLGAEPFLPFHLAPGEA